jgi:D-3-phosphoglycerate dehydrogenase
MTIPRVLISDALSDAAVDVFRTRGIEIDFQPRLGSDHARLAEVIGGFDGLAVRSATRVGAELIKAANGRLRVVGRAGIGVDNVDLQAATAAGVIVMNTPFGNSVTTAEHAIALLMTLARHISPADRSTQAGKWEKSRFMGVEITGKVLGILGCGNIGSLVAERAHGLRMKVITFDPFLSKERAAELAVETVDLDDLLSRSDFITLHTPLTDKTKGIIDAAAIAKMKDGVRIINCARGELVVEEDLAAALRSGKAAGAAIDVFSEEPARTSPLFGLDNVLCTPHLGAATAEAQEKVAVQIAEQMADYLIDGAISNALNMPSMSSEEAWRLTPFRRLTELLGSFVGQLTESPIKAIRIEYAGDVAETNTNPLTSALLSGLLESILTDLNMVNAPIVARERGISVDETKQSQRGPYQTYIRLTVITEREERSVAGTVFSDGRPRIIEMDGVGMEADFSGHMLCIASPEVSAGLIGHLGTVLSDNGIGLASLHFGHNIRDGSAIALAAVNRTVPQDVLETIARHEHAKQVKPLALDHALSGGL